MLLFRYAPQQTLIPLVEEEKMDFNEKVVELLQEIRDNQMKQIEAATKMRSLYVRVLFIVLIFFAILYGPYYLQLFN